MSKEIYEILDGGDDGTNKTTIAFTDNKDLASRLSLGRGTMGYGNGDIITITLYSSFEDLPADLKNQVLVNEQGAETSLQKKIEKIVEELSSVEKEILKKIINKD